MAQQNGCSMDLAVDDEDDGLEEGDDFFSRPYLYDQAIVMVMLCRLSVCNVMYCG